MGVDAGGGQAGGGDENKVIHLPGPKARPLQAAANRLLPQVARRFHISFVSLGKGMVLFKPGPGPAESAPFDGRMIKDLQQPVNIPKRLPEQPVGKLPRLPLVHLVFGDGRSHRDNPRQSRSLQPFP